MPDYVRLMRHEDIDQVVVIDREAFPTEWPPPNFKRELENRLATYIVACNATELTEETEETPPQGGLTMLLSRVSRLFTPGRLPDSKWSAKGGEYITGFAGFWVMADEAHITTIATRQTCRQQGIGELLLQSIIDMAARREARIITLEVRASNTAAQKLYTKYGFTQVGLRHGYYIDNREDAIIMSTDHITSPSFKAQIKEIIEAYTTKWGPDRYRMST
ncbi:MAG: ribosomal protein S18-alanine N-acetyltransferase [Dehalococcoidales bacterium]|nr:MAG: ribosomal protein S18-alanine N-acetyltransferase [Dehalococcoidales bacterium]